MIYIIENGKHIGMGNARVKMFLASVTSKNLFALWLKQE
jgi:hypothetical protein